MEIPEFGLDIQEVQKRRNGLKWKRQARFWSIVCGVVVLITIVVLFSPIGPWRGWLFPATPSSPAEAPAPIEDGHAASDGTVPPPVIQGDNGSPAQKTSDLRPPCVAIIVDDVGNGDVNLGQWLAIDAPLTFSVMPYYAGNTSEAEVLYQAGFQVMMHIPTANKPPGSFSGKGQIESGMDQATVSSTLDTDITQVPFAVGINNHQGGAGCDDLALMTKQCEWALERGFFVVDSNSSVKPQVAIAAMSLGLGKKKNQVFIDHDNNPDYIRQAMRNLADLARRNGYAVGICHWMRPNTPSTVGEMIKTLRDEGIHFAFVQYVNN